MTDRTYTDITMVLDRSGSMSALREATIEGFNAFIAEQRGTTGRCTLTLVQFDHEYESVYTAIDLAVVPPLVLVPRGTTALLDAIGQAVHATGARLGAMPETERPGSVIIGIMTDGHENASRELTHAAVKALITEQTEKYSWTFLYLGANQDAIEVGVGLGVAAGLSLTYGTARARDALVATGANVARMRDAVATGAAPAVARAAHAYTTEQRESVE